MEDLVSSKVVLRLVGSRVVVPQTEDEYARRQLFSRGPDTWRLDSYVRAEPCGIDSS